MVAKKKTARRTTASKSGGAAKKPVKKIASPKKAAPKKAIASRKAAPDKKAAAKAVAAPVQSEAPARKVPRKKPAVIDPLTPRTGKRSAIKLDVLRPGRKKKVKNTAKPKSFRPLSAEQKERYRIQLIEIRDRLSGQITSLKKESLTRADEVNVEEDGTDAFDRQFALSLASSENESLVDIDAALQRLADGTLGQCNECGGGIEMARLKAIPFASNCIACQSEVEKQRPGYRPPFRID
jgi:RNA polymerase-binding transcription factor DksA